MPEIEPLFPPNTLLSDSHPSRDMALSTVLWSLSLKLECYFVLSLILESKGCLPFLFQPLQTLTVFCSTLMTMAHVALTV